MESKGFLLNFSDLASGSEGLIKSAVASMQSTLHASSGEVDTMLGKLTPSLKYTVDRLLKGLTGGKLAKLGYSLALCMILREFHISTDKLYDYFETLDHSGISQYQIFIGTTLISLCLSRTGKASSKSLIGKLEEIYKSKASLNEVTGLAVLSLPNAKNVAKRVGSQSDINGLMINYATQSHETVMVQSSRHKEILIKGTFRALPRLHHIWKTIVSASIALEKEHTIWINFVEKDIKIDDKFRTRRILFSFLLFEEFSLQKANLSNLLTRDFFDTWQDNVFSKKLRDHTKALSLRDTFFEFLKALPNQMAYLQKLFELLSEVKTLDMIKSFTEVLLGKCDLDVKKWYLKEISGFTKEKKGNFAVGEYWFVAKTSPELIKPCIKKLIQLSYLQGGTGEAARGKVLNLASECSQVDLIYTLFEAQTPLAEKVLKTVKRVKKYEIKQSESVPGKRKPGELSMITSGQLEGLKQLLMLIGIEAVLYDQIEDFSEIYRLVKDLYKAKAKNIDELSMFLFSAFARPVGYIRTGIKKVFKLFVNEISEDFLKKVCEIIRSGEVNLDTQMENVEANEENGINTLFQENNSNVTKQEKIVKDNFLVKAADVLEIVMKKSENIEHKLFVYETLIVSLRSASKSKDKQHLIGKFSAILQKIHKKPFPLLPVHEPSLISLIYLCIKGMYRDKNVNKVLSRNFSCLLATLDDLNASESLKIVLELLAKFFEKHNSHIKQECLTEIVSKFRYAKQIQRKLLEYLKAGRSPVIQVQSAEVLKACLKQWKLENEKLVKSLISITKIVEKQEIKLKLKNNIIKNILLGIYLLVKNSQGLGEDLCEEVEKLRLFIGDRPLFHGIFTQIKSAKRNS